MAKDSRLNGKKHIVVIKDGELLPIQENSPCLRLGSLAAQLVSDGHHVTWLATTWSHQFKEKIDNPGIFNVSAAYDVVLLECGSYQRNISFSRLLHHRRFAKRITAWLNQLEIQPDLILAAYPIPGAAASAARYAKDNDIPFILDIRDLWPDVFIDKLGKTLSSLASPFLAAQTRDLKKALSVATAVTAVSQKYLQWGLENTPAKLRGDKKFLFYPIGAQNNSSDQDFGNSELNSLFDNLSGKTIFAFLGSFGKSYDLDIIVKAARHYEELGQTDIHFCVAGDGEQRPLVEDAAQRLSNLSYLGWLNSSQTAAFLRCSDVGMMPLQSVSGTFPNKPFQYMAASLPIISSLEGEFADFLMEHRIGINFDVGDEHGFIAAIDQLLQRDDREEMQERVKALFDKNFEQKVIYSKFARTVEDLCHTNVDGTG
ncbi:glycosyltransferase family 4 protein [Parasphingorhabdus sp.]|uniref:glycosyltransferase family 4 protein n=1 Tax=Parasphingorhabdus sp. TaxID=2709688 RepID=UPI003A901E36